MKDDLQNNNYKVFYLKKYDIEYVFKVYDDKTVVLKTVAGKRDNERTVSIEEARNKYKTLLNCGYKNPFKKRIFEEGYYGRNF